MGCRSCELACALAHSAAEDLASLVASDERPGHSISVEACGKQAVPVHCNHCEDAPCVLACPTGAMHREKPDGPVTLDTAKCIGCSMCVQACPFGVLTVRRGGRGVLKCDLCIERLAKGLEPACVAACPTKALVFCEEEEVVKTKRRQAAERLVSAQERGETETDNGE